MDNVHAVAQSIWDIRRLLHWIRDTQAGERIGVQGLSLGGYTVALLAGIESDLSCVILGVPAVDFTILMEQHAPSRFRSDPRLDRLTALASDVHRVISPLAFAPKVPYDRRFIYAGLADRLIHPVRQVQRPVGTLGRTRHHVVPGRSRRLLRLASGARASRARTPIVGHGGGSARPRGRIGAVCVNPTGRVIAAG